MRTFVVCLAVAACLAACSQPTGDGSATEVSLLQHEIQWSNRDFHSYSFDIVDQHFGGTYRAHVSVVNDVVTSAVDPITGVASDAPVAWPTIDALFETAHGAVGKRGLQVTLKFNDQLGYLTELDISSNNPGGPYSAVVSNLQPL